MNSFYDSLNDIAKEEIDNLDQYKIDEDQTLLPDSTVRLKENGFIGKVLWLTEEGHPIVRIAGHNMRMLPEGLVKLKNN